MLASFHGLVFNKRYARMTCSRLHKPLKSLFRESINKTDYTTTVNINELEVSADRTQAHSDTAIRRVHRQLLTWVKIKYES